MAELVFYIFVFATGNWELLVSKITYALLVWKFIKIFKDFKDLYNAAKTPSPSAALRDLATQDQDRVPLAIAIAM